MQTMRALGKWWVPLAGIYLILVGIILLTNLAVPGEVLGVLALVAGILALLSS